MRKKAFKKKYGVTVELAGLSGGLKMALGKLRRFGLRWGHTRCLPCEFYAVFF